MFRDAEAAAKGIDINGQEVQNELREFMEARSQAKGDTAKKDSPATASGEVVEEQEEEDGTFKSLVWAIMNCPTCKGKETVACFRTCRYGGALEEESGGKTWSECLDKCVTNRFLRATIWAMLPRES